jgi:hypothetical protein
MFAPRLPKDIDPASLLTQISDQKNRDSARYFHFLGLPGDNAFRRLLNLPSNSWTKCVIATWPAGQGELANLLGEKVLPLQLVRSWAW